MAEEPEPRVVTDEEVAAFMDAKELAAMEPVASPEEREAVREAVSEAVDEAVYFTDPESGERFLIPPEGLDLDDTIARRDVEEGRYPGAEE